MTIDNLGKRDVNDWGDLSRQDPTDWLMDEGNPSVRYFTLVDILGNPTDSPKVVRARKAIAPSEPVTSIFSRQCPGGWWDTPERATGIKRASGQLLILSQMGIEPDERTDMGCEFVLSKPWLTQRVPICIPPCYTANCLRFLAHFNYGEDPRLDAGWVSLLTRLEEEAGLICWYQRQRPCHWFAVKSLWALSCAPSRYDVSKALIKTSEALLGHSFDFAGEEARWLKFGFPWYMQSDLLDALEALIVCGYAKDIRVRALARHLLVKQQGDGRWLLEGGSAAMRFEAKGKPSKWITLKALRVIKAVRNE
jgi:hypothetical protein